jgi:thiamine pyrophosphokinase
MRCMNIVIFSGGAVQKGYFVTQALKNADFIIAADCGAKSALEFRSTPSIVIGDMDSLDSEIIKKLKQKKIPFLKYPTMKDKTDTQLALDYAIKQKAKRISIIGGTKGNRLDHILANIFLLTTTKTDVSFIDGDQRTWIKKGPCKESVTGKKNDLLSLIPLSEKVTGIVTIGLKYSLHNETLHLGQSRGVSNVLLQNSTTVSFESGLFIIIHTHTTKSITS